MDSHASRGLNEVNAPQDSSLNTARGDRATDGSSCLSGQADSFGFEGDGLVDLAVGADLGGVTIVRLLAEGGMGRVYEGRQQAPSRAVAVKVLRNGLASPALMRQFEQEAHLLARLRHPHIAQVHTLGTWRYGGVVLPFFVMELVEAAQAIDCHARDHRLPMRQRVDLMRRVAAAVAYGHALGVVHRDLKPGNILVGADGEPKVIDFGVARATDVDRALATLQTDAGQIVGTLRYMSPEQIDANSGQIGPWTDVYALGLVLHEVLSGDLPYDVRGQPIMVAARIWSIDAEGIFHTAHVLRGHSGPIWSAAFAADGSRAVTAADGKATVWSVEDGSMITEMRCHESTIYGIVFSPDGQMLATAAGDGSVRLWDAATGEQRAVFAPEWPASARDQNIYGVAFSADGARLAAACGDGVVRLWDLGRALDTQSAPVTLLGHTRRVFAVCFSPDGRWIASASEDATARLWNVENGSVGGVFRHSLRVNGVAFNASGSRLATVSADAILRLWDPATGRTELELVGHRDAVWGVARLSAERFVTAAADTTARVWDGDRGDQPILADGAGDTAGEGQGVRGVAYSPDGRLAATATSRGLVQLWDPVTCRNVRDIPAGRSRVNSVEFSPAGDLLAAGCGDGVTRLIRVADSTEVGRFAGHSGPVFAAAFSPDGCLLASAGDQRGSGTDGVSSGSGQAGTVRIRRLPGGDDAVAPLEHPGSVYGAAWSPDGTRLATACGDGLVRVWDAAAGRLQRTLAGHRLAVNWVAFSPDGSRLASCASDGTVRFWDARDGRLLAVLEEPVGQVWEVAFSPDGSRLAGVGADGCLHLWHAESGRHLLALGGHSAQAWGVVFAPDGTGILTGAQDGTARLWGVSPATVHRRRAGRESGFVGVDDDGG